jgi:hypothetical protein
MTDTTVIKKTPHMIATPWERPKPKPKIKPLAPEMANHLHPRERQPELRMDLRLPPRQMEC